MENGNNVDSCERNGGGCPTLMGLIVTLVLAIAAVAGLQALARAYLPLDGTMLEVAELGIALVGIVSGVILLRAFRAKR